MTIIWYMVPEIWSAPDRIFFPSCTIFCPFTPLPAWKMKMSKKWKNAWIYHNFTQVYQTLWSQTVPEIWHVIDVLVIFHLGLYFLLLPPLPPSNSPKNENLKKEWKKKPGDIILHKRTKNHGHMPYCSWDMAHDRCNCYFSFWAIFYSFTPVTARKNKISKKMKKTPGDIIILHKCTKNHDHMQYCSCDMASGTCIVKLGNCCALELEKATKALFLGFF